MTDENERVRCPNCKRSVVKLREMMMPNGNIVLRCGECKLFAMRQDIWKKARDN